MRNIIPLYMVPIGSFAVIRELISDGSSRRKMLDLGLVQNTQVKSLRRSPSGDPIAYQIRGAVIALRSEEASKVLVDLPGTYSLLSNSVEEEVARDFICFGNPHATLVIADATCLERNLNLVLQILEMTDKVVVCVNLMDEAKRKKLT